MGFNVQHFYRNERKTTKFRLRLKIEKDIPVGRPTALDRLFERAGGRLGASSMIVTFGWMN